MNKLKLNVFWYELFFFTLISILSLSIIGYLIKMFKKDARLLTIISLQGFFVFPPKDFLSCLNMFGLVDNKTIE